MANIKSKGGDFLSCNTCDNDRQFDICGIERATVNGNDGAPGLWHVLMRCPFCQVVQTFTCRGRNYQGVMKKLADTMKDHCEKNRLTSYESWDYRTGKTVYQTENTKGDGLYKELHYA